MTGFLLLLALLSPLPQSLREREFTVGAERFRHGCPPELTEAALAQGREVDEDGYPLDAFRAGEIVLALEPGGRAAAAVVHAGLGARVVERMEERELERVELPAGLSVAQAIRAYRRLPLVRYAGRNVAMRLAEVPHDALYSKALPGQWAYKRINVERAWDITKGASWIQVAVIDTGIFAHDDLAGGIKPGRNVLLDNSNVTDNDGHGTEIAQIIAANHNHFGIAGIAPQVWILPVKVCEASEDAIWSWDIAEGIWWARDQGVEVINLSLSGPYYDMVLDWATSDAWDANCVVVAGAGNEGVDTPSYPAANANVLSVAMTNYLTDERHKFSNYGSWVDVAAPGTNVEVSQDETYLGFGVSGTSYACPMVSGTAALACSVFGTGYHNWQVVQRITGHCDSNLSYVQHGRINAREALSGINEATHASWPAAVLFPGTFQVVGGNLSNTNTSYGNDVSFDTLSIGSSTTVGSFTQHFQTLRVPFSVETDRIKTVDDVVVVLEGRANVANLPLSLQALNWTSGAWDTIGTQNLVSTTVDSTLTYTIGSPAPYFDASNTMHLRYHAQWSGFTSLPPFLVEMDLIRARLVFVP
jgi:thermitase